MIKILFTNVKIKDFTSIIVILQKISYAFILSILIINAFFSLFFNLGNYSFVKGFIMSVFQGCLIQTNTDDELRDNCMNLGMTKTYINDIDVL